MLRTTRSRSPLRAVVRGLGAPVVPLVLALVLALVLTFGLVGCSDSAEPAYDPAADVVGQSVLAEDAFRTYASENLAPLGTPEVVAMDHQMILDDSTLEDSGISRSFQEYVWTGVERDDLEQVLRDTGGFTDVDCTSLDDWAAEERQEWVRSGQVEECHYSEPFGPDLAPSLWNTGVWWERYEGGRTRVVVAFEHDPRR